MKREHGFKFWVGGNPLKKVTGSVKHYALILFSVCAVGVATSNSYAGGEDDSLVLTVNAAVQVSIRDNPRLAEVTARFQALSEIPPQVGALPDPMISFNAMNLPADTFDREQEQMTQLQIGFSQSFPFPGKLNLKEEAAEFDAQAAGYSVEEVRLQLIKNVKAKWWQLFYMDRALETVATNQDLLRQFIAVAKTKYETGRGLQQDVLLSQLELSKLMDQEIQLQAIRRNQEIALNILMDKPATNSIALQRKVSKLMPKLVGETELYQKAESVRPSLKVKETQIEAARSRLELARRDYYPDFKLGLVYGDRAGNNPLPRGGERADFVSLQLGIKVPLYFGRKQAKAVSQKSLEVQQNRYALIDEKARVTAAISSATTDYQRSTQQYSLYGNGIVPQAQQTVQSMLAGYQVSEVDFLNLVRSQITLFNYELQYWKALSDANQALARLEAVVGEENIYE